ncbi:translation initiation factor Sui1 [Pelovirga terrestris]|uniref:Translation initiation factor Sui1 n=1 Tax=Pelovirga terrestris TaxID=2771352 RepID=A0A8J6QVL7_9BACT|nr:translation initiation factor Sui1 [Pelovirga terrestris]MBD1401870.1 translation initiation factor Sui1 [Pelovirga terrestris]
MSNSRPVYSDQLGRLCPQCAQPQKKCRCTKKPAAPKGDGSVRIQRETKGRKGKGVTLITGLDLEPQQLKDLAKELKQRCGTGGTVKEGIVEIQGDQRDLLLELLQQRGFKVKKAGG